jgi:uncharacterized protein with PIN domain
LPAVNSVTRNHNRDHTCLICNIANAPQIAPRRKQKRKRTSLKKQKLCPECFSKFFSGSHHRCLKSARLENINANLSYEKERITSRVLKESRTGNLNLATGGRSSSITVSPPNDRHCSIYSHDTMFTIAGTLNLSSNDTLKLASSFRYANGTYYTLALSVVHKHFTCSICPSRITTSNGGQGAKNVFNFHRKYILCEKCGEKLWCDFTIEYLIFWVVGGAFLLTV